MIDGQKIGAILALYKKHGWRLRRVLLTPETQSFLGNDFFFVETEVVTADVDAAWFSRASGTERAAWELRHLSENPYALLEVFDDDEDEEVREEALFELEEKLKEAVGRSAKK